MKPLDDRLRTGHAKIDEQHCSFIGHLNVMREAIEAGAGRERIVELIILLQQYSLVHFSDEEDYMRRVKCEALAQNCAAHREFSTKLEGWLVLLSASGSSVTLLKDIQRESATWIVGHIASVDCKLRSCRAD